MRVRAFGDVAYVFSGGLAIGRLYRWLFEAGDADSWEAQARKYRLDSIPEGPTQFEFYLGENTLRVVGQFVSQVEADGKVHRETEAIQIIGNSVVEWRHSVTPER